MSTLIVDEYLSVDLSQPFRVSGAAITVAAIKPQLYVHNLPAGTFTMKLVRDSVELLSWDFTSAQLQESIGASMPWFYVKYPLFKQGGFRLDRGDYLLTLTSVGYLYSSGAWLGWCKDWQGPRVEIYDPQPESFIGYPYAFEMLSYGDSDK